MFSETNSVKIRQRTGSKLKILTMLQRNIVPKMCKIQMSVKHLSTNLQTTGLDVSTKPSGELVKVHRIVFDLAVGLSAGQRS